MDTTCTDGACFRHLLGENTSHALDPLRSIPTELWMYIFGFVDVKNRNDVVTLMLVCRTWNAIVTNTSEIWASFLGLVDANSLSEEYLRKLLERSASRKLSLRLNTTAALVTSDPGLVLHTWRITSLNVNLSLFEYLNIVTTFRNRHFPMLEALTMTSESLYELPTNYTQLERLADGDLPCLRFLRIPGVLSPTMVVGSLTALELEPAGNSHLSLVKIPASELLAALKRCHVLQSLAVNLNPNISPSSESWLFTSTDATGQSCSPVSLSHLRHLHILEIHKKALHSGVISQLVAQILFPPTAAVTLQGMGHMFDFVLPSRADHGPLPMFLAPMDRIALSHRHRTNCGLWVESESEIEASLNGARVFLMSVTDRFSSPQYRVAFQVAEIRKLCRFSAHTIRTFEYCYTESGCSCSHAYGLRQLLGMFPGLSCLVLKGWPLRGGCARSSKNQGEDILSALVNTDADPNLKHMVICPMLEELDVICVEDVNMSTLWSLEKTSDRILEVLTSRKSRLKLLTVQVPERWYEERDVKFARYSLVKRLGSVVEDVLVKFSNRSTAEQR